MTELTRSVVQASARPAILDLVSAAMAMALAYGLRFGVDAWELAAWAWPVLGAVVLVQAVACAAATPRRAGGVRTGVLPIGVAAVSGLTIGALLVLAGHGDGVSRVALAIQALLFVAVATSWRRFAPAAGPRRRAEATREEPAGPRSADAPVSARRAGVAAMVPGALVGAALAIGSLSFGFITGTGPFWDRPLHDFNAYLVAWQYFLDDVWRWPLLDLPMMGYPEGGSVLFNDALPVGVLISKAIYSVSGIAINPYGLWLFCSYVLLGGFTSMAVKSAGVSSAWSMAAAAFLVISKVLFMRRLGHVAVSSHFLIVWALWLYAEDVRRGGLSFLHHLLLSSVAILVNAYLTAMVAVIQGATFVTLLWQRRVRWADTVRAAGIVLAVALIAVAEGYAAMFTNSSGSMRAEGFGVFSWNLATLIVPPDYLWGDWGVVRDATGGQYEGDGYVGAGVVVLLGIVVGLRARRCLALASRHWILMAAITACALFAASNKIYAGAWLLADFDLPGAVQSAAAFFRASGRFIWIAVYALTIGVVVACARWLPRTAGIAALVAAVALQAVEATNHAARVRERTALQPAPQVDDDQLVAWFRAHDRYFQWPSYSCGGMVPNSAWGGSEVNRELHIQLLLARLGIPTNSVYTSRQLKDCGAEQQWGADAVLEDGVFYILNKSAAQSAPRVAALAASSQCLDAGFVYMCSRMPWTVDDRQSGRTSIDVVPFVTTGCVGDPKSPVVVEWRAPAGRAVEVRVGSPEAPASAAGAEGRLELQVSPGTNVYLMDQDTGEILDIDSSYHRAETCMSSDQAAGGRE